MPYPELSASSGPCRAHCSGLGTLLVTHGTQDAAAATFQQSCEPGTDDIMLLVNHGNGDVARVTSFSRLDTWAVDLATSS